MATPEPGWYELRYARAQAYRQDLLFKNGADGTAIDLRDHWLIARIWPEDGIEPAAELDVELSEPAAGAVALLLSGEQSASLPELAFWELLVVEPGGNERIWLRGTVSEL